MFYQRPFQEGKAKNLAMAFCMWEQPTSLNLMLKNEMSERMAAGQAV